MKLREKPAAAAGTRGSRLNPFRSIGMQLLIYFFLVIVIGVSAVGFISYAQSNEIIRDQVMESKRLTAIQAGEKLSLVLQQYEAKSLEVMFMDEIKQLSASYRQNPDDIIGQLNIRRALESRLNSYVFADNSIMAVHLFAISPDFPSMSPASSRIEDIRKQPWFAQAIEKDGVGFWIPTSREGISGMQRIPSFGYARLVKDQSTFDHVYVGLMEIREKHIQEVLEGALGADSAMYVIDGAGNILSSGEVGEIGTAFPVRLQGDAAEGAVFRGEIGGTEMLIAHRTVDRVDWTLAGLEEFAPLLKGTEAIRDLSWFMTLCGAVAASLIGLMVMVRIGMPLRHISQLMKRAEQGDLSVEAGSTRRRDEIGTLANGFNEMLANIRALVRESHQSASEVTKTAAELGEASRRTATSAQEIAQATEQIAVGASNVAVEAEKVADMTGAMGARMTHTVETNSRMTAAATDIRRSSRQGTEYMQQLSAKTSETEHLTQIMLDKVEELKKSTASIQDILGLLGAITKQTNILSLNATIEAARAGEAGKGFMVVAGEIRKLADQSKQSIETVGDITDRIRNEIEETVALMGKAYPMFQEQIASVKQSNEIFESVNSRMGEFDAQLRGATDAFAQLEETQKSLTEAMSNVSAVAEQSSATSEEVASLTSDQLQVGETLVNLAGRLEDVSIRLRDTLNKFRM